MSELVEIEKQIADLQAKKQKLLDEQRGKVLEETRKTVELYGFTARELGLVARTKGAATPKAAKPVTYRDASDPANVLEWDGELSQKGRKPEWIKSRVADGTIDQYRVKG